MPPLHAAASGLDFPTLLLLATSIAILLGIFLLFAWLQERSMRALAWWGGAYLTGGCAMALWNAPAALPVPAEFPSALMFVACGMIWNGVRLFHGRKILPVAANAGALVWLLLAQLPMFGEASAGRVILGAVVVSVYAFFTAYELRCDRRRTSRARAAAVVVPLVHAAIFLTPIGLKAVSADGAYNVFGSNWFDLFVIETMLYAVGTAFIMLFLVKDHHVQFHKTAASTDPLTGLFNRRAFFENAAILCARAAKSRQQVSVLMFDLDHFKSINDRFGHATGDDVLRTFAATARSSLRADDVVARLGGEEFAAILPGGPDVAGLVAERVRASFEVTGRDVSDIRIGATVSIGAACASGPVEQIEHLIERADGALYRAKKDGRNRVQVASAPENLLPIRLIAAARAANSTGGIPSAAMLQRHNRPAAGTAH